MQTPSKIIKKRLTLLLAALTLAAPQVGSLPEVLQSTPFAISEAEAQTRTRGRDYRDSDLNRYSTVTRTGVITSNPNDDYFELRTDNGETLRVLARGNVSVRNYRRNDRVEVTGRRDGRNLIATSIRRSSNTSNRQETLRATVISYPGNNNRFTIRHNNRPVTVIASGNDARNLRYGQEVEVRGTWRNNMFHADRVQVIGRNDDRGRGNNWGRDNDRVERVDFRGTIQRATRTSNNNEWDYIVRTNGRDYIVRTRDRHQFRIGDRVRVRGELRVGRVIATDIDRF